MANMTENEILTGLECQAGAEIFCKDCAFIHLGDHGFACKKNVSRAAIDLINHQKAKIEGLYKELQRIALMTTETNSKERED